MTDTTELELAPVQPGEPHQKQIQPFDHFKAELEKLKATAETLTVTSIDDKAGMKLARATRLTLKELRVSVEKRRKELGEHHLREPIWAPRQSPTRQMNLCDDGHEEVCYDGRKCPVCSVITDKSTEIKGLEKQIDDLKSEVSDLSSQLSDSHGQP